MAQIGGKTIDALKIEKGSCTAAANAPGFICDLRMGFETGARTQFGPWLKGRFFQAGSGWNFEESR